MSSKLKPLDLTGAVVGFQGTIDFNQFVKFQPNNQAVKAHVRLLNESGCGLDITFQASGNSHVLPAGGWGTFEIEPNDGTVQATVTYTLPNPPVSMLLAMYYGPGEQVPISFTLGNSPIGIGGTIPVGNVTLSNEGNAVNTLFIDGGPSGNLNVIQIFNDHFTWSVVQSGVAHTVLQGKTSGNPLLIGQAGDISEVLGQLLVDQLLTAAAAFLLTNGAFTAKLSCDPAINALNCDSPNGTRVAQFKSTTATFPQDVVCTGDITANGSHTITSTFFSLIAGSGHYSMYDGSLSRLTVFSGTGNGTVATGLSVTPTTICTDCCSVSGSSQTIGFTNAQSSVVTTGAGLAWNGTAIHT